MARRWWWNTPLGIVALATRSALVRTCSKPSSGDAGHVNRPRRPRRRRPTDHAPGPRPQIGDHLDNARGPRVADGVIDEARHVGPWSGLSIEVVSQARAWPSSCRPTVPNSPRRLPSSWCRPTQSLTRTALEQSTELVSEVRELSGWVLPQRGRPTHSSRSRAAVSAVSAQAAQRSGSQPCSRTRKL